MTELTTSAPGPAPGPASAPAPARPARARGTLPAFTPVPRHDGRHTGWTPDKQRSFIEALADYGSVRAAANAVGMTSESAYQLRRHPQAAGFRKAWEAALDRGVERLEDIAMERALHGVEVPVYSYGKLVGARRVYNDRLLMFVLRNRAAARFAANTGRALTPSQQKAEAEREKRKLARLKDQWRAEWEAEWEAAQPDEEQILEEIRAKLRAMRENKLEAERLLAENEARREDIAEEEDPFAHWPTPDPATLPRRLTPPAPPSPPYDSLSPVERWHHHMMNERIEIVPSIGRIEAASPGEED